MLISLSLISRNFAHLQKQYGMRKKILVIHYSQSGQLTEILSNLTLPLQEDIQNFEVFHYSIQPEKDFPFPWTRETFFDAFPESYQQIPIPILPPPQEILNQKYDLIIFGYQVWYLTPSIPIISFLKSQWAKELLHNTPIITLSATRNMWMYSQEKLKVHLKKLNAQLVGNIALVDRHNNYTSVLTIVRWMMTGNKIQNPPLPPAGIAQQEIDNASKYGHIIKPYILQNQYEGMQKKLVEHGAVEVRPFLVKVETVGNKAFSLFSRQILKNPAQRKLWLRIFVAYLYIGIWVASPIVLFFFTIFTPVFSAKRKKKVQYFQGI